MLISSSFSQYLGYYKDKRLLTVFAFGISSGFPWVLIGSVMSAWLKDEGLSRSTIGLFGLVYGAYTINFLWSPLVDRVKIPLLYNRLGQRRSWIASCQFIIIVATFALATISIKDHLSHAALLCFIIALFSATQDIAIDAYRIDILPEDESEKATAAAAMATSGWWSGYALLGAIPFFMADLPGFSWPIIYQMLSVIVVCLLVVTLLAKEPKSHREQVQELLQKSYEQKLNHSASSSASKKIYAWLAVTLVEPFKRFFEKNGVKTACALLAFIFLFKIGEAFLARMSIVFYKEVGFTNTQIGQYSKLGTGVITIVFAFLGSIFNHKYGIVKGLFISGVAMAASNLMFSWIAIA